MADKEQKHKTSHSATADEEGKVLVYCETCKWRDHVDVKGLYWAQAMTAIFAARDEHEANPEKGNTDVQN